MAATRTLRPASEADLGTIAAIHRAAYSRRHFTSRLTPATLIDYYRLFLSGGPTTLLLIERAPDGGHEEVLGFAVCGSEIAARIALFKRTHIGPILRASAANPVAAGSKGIKRLVTRALHGPAGPAADYLLLSIAVARPGTGAGGMLLDAVLDHAAADGADRIGLYVNVDNLAAINAYTSRRFTLRELYGQQYYMERAV